MRIHFIDENWNPQSVSLGTHSRKNKKNCAVRVHLRGPLIDLVFTVGKVSPKLIAVVWSPYYCRGKLSSFEAFSAVSQCLYSVAFTTVRFCVANSFVMVTRLAANVKYINSTVKLQIVAKCLILLRCELAIFFVF